MSREVIWAVLGPTGSGKTRLAIEMAERINGEIVSVDSAQVFRGLDVGTAKATAQEQDRVRHHVLDTIEPSEQWSAADYVKAADLAIADIRGRGKFPIVCGGTGLWYRALTKGIFSVPEIDPDIRESVRESIRVRGSVVMHEELKKVDPIAASKIQPADPQRIGRALEVFQQTGTPISTLQAQHGFQEARYIVGAVALDCPRETLRERVAVRAEQMYASGILQETEACLDRGISLDAPGLSVIGYRDAVRHLQGEYTLEQATEQTITSTRRYAKRQRNWFRHEPEVQWVSYESDVSDVIRQLQLSTTNV